MSKKQSVILMNLLAKLIRYVNRFTLPFRLIHALVRYEAVSECVRREMERSLRESKDIDVFLQNLQERIQDTIASDDQENMLRAYHLCIWIDRMLTYEDASEDKLSIYELIPLRAYSYVAIDALNDNYRETGIWINPKLPIFKTSMVLDDGTERERVAASRDAFVGINGDFRNISYFEWNKKYVVHNIIVPYEYRGVDGADNADGNIRAGFIPILDRCDLMIPECRNCREGKYELKKMYISAPNHEAIIEERLERGLEMACEHQVDVVFAPEMLGTVKTEQCRGNYNEFLRHVYSNAVMNGRRPPLITVMPSYWHNGINSAAIVYRDGRVLGRQKKYTPYVDFGSCAVEGLQSEKVKELYLLHMYGIHRIVVSICAEFLDGFDSDFICGQLGATFIIVPSFSHGERDFVSKLGSFFPYGTSVLWGDCCGAVAYSPKVIGGCSLIGSNEIYKMGNNCNCSFSCEGSRGCLFTVDFPLKVVYTKEAAESYQPIRHILT